MKIFGIFLVLVLTISLIISGCGDFKSGTCGNGICESGEKNTCFTDCKELLVVCNSPYIQKGSECCLDQNNNRICDSDETSIKSNNIKQPIELLEPMGYLDDFGRKKVTTEYTKIDDFHLETRKSFLSEGLSGGFYTPHIILPIRINEEIEQVRVMVECQHGQKRLEFLYPEDLDSIFYCEDGVPKSNYEGDKPSKSYNCIHINFNKANFNEGVLYAMTTHDLFKDGSIVYEKAQPGDYGILFSYILLKYGEKNDRVNCIVNIHSLNPKINISQEVSLSYIYDSIK